MLESYEYCPVLRTRNAELKALLYLGNQAKNLIFPLVSISPLPNAKHLSSTTTKIQEAFGERRFALDLDGDIRGSANVKPAQAEFESLFDPKNGFYNYYQFVKSIPMASPVLRLEAGVANIKIQLQHVAEIDRGLFLRVQYSSGANSIIALTELLEDNISVIPIIDMGWATDVILRQVWAEGVLNVIRANANELPIEIVVAASSFPDSFAKMGGHKDIRIDERDMFSSMQSKFNEFEITYGDWASTRARQPPTPMVPIPRIDLPRANEWALFRSEQESYSDVAARVIASHQWDPSLQIWGTELIKWTAASDPAGIKSPAAATAARINIHMHMQAFFETGEIASDTSEPFTDDF
jgi:hypothetical protein